MVTQLRRKLKGTWLGKGRLSTSIWIWIIRSVEIDVRRWTLVVAVATFDTFGFLRPYLLPCGEKNRPFLVGLSCLIVKRPNLSELFSVVWIFPWFLGFIWYGRWILRESHKNYLKDKCIIHSQNTCLILKHSLNFISLKPSFINIQDLHSNFVGCESFLESNFSDILALCETNLNNSIDSTNFSVQSYLPLIRKTSATNICLI